jgi:hypothetical protein
MAKEVEGLIKLQIRGGAANPSPPVGPALGAKGVNIMEFCKQFNGRTQEQAGKLLPVIITVYKDKSSYTDEDKDNDINQFENNEIDLCDYLRETLLIEIPMKPLHSEDCKGICPVCGINKNEENCDCQMELKHNPFDKLDELKLKKKEN